MKMTLTRSSKFNIVISFLVFLVFQYANAQITLTNNIGTTLVKTDMYSCKDDESWSRVFKLSDFGIAPNEQFIIKSGQIGIAKSEAGSNLFFSVYIVDNRFPDLFNSYFEKPLLGTGGFKPTKVIDGNPEIVQIDFDKPIIVPAGIERILVTVSKQKDYTNYTSAEVFIAGTAQDKGDSWYGGCEPNRRFTRTTDLAIPVPAANFYINVTGEAFKSKSTGPITRLSHNVCDDVIETAIHSCSSTNIYWARAFTLKDFGISNNEEFVINSGQVAINKTGWQPNIKFNIYKIDNNFPASFSETNLIGSSQSRVLQYGLGHESQIVQVDFDTPIVIPAGVERILVEVHKGIEGGEGVAFIAGSAQDNDVSWQRGCTNLSGAGDKYVSTADFGFPNANFYINVTGNVKNVSSHFEMNFSNICSEFLKEFSVDDQSKVASIAWNFGDPASGTTNTSTDLSPFHDFSADGRYIVTAIVTGKDGTVETLSEIIDAKEPPKAYGISNLYACESISGTGISKSFDVSTVTQQLLGGQTDKDVTFIDGKGNKYTSLPNPFTNIIKDRETITVRVSHKDNLCCYSETTFDLIVNPLPNLSVITDLNTCDNDTDGFAQFNLKPIETLIVGSATNIKVEFYHQNGQKIVDPLNAISNLVLKEEIIKVKAINTDTNCFNETTFKLIVNPLPIANSLQELIGCDDNNDGISEYFDTSNVESSVLGSQQSMKVSYFDTNGNPLISPLPNPYTNTANNQEIITVRVTNTLTSCYTETSLVLKTASQPQINKPANKYACDEGNGFASFDMSNLETEIIGNQSGLKIMYFDNNRNPLPDPLPILFKNTQSKSQTIYIRVENEANSLCNSETSFDLIINDLPNLQIDKTYFLCNLEPSLPISVDNTLDSYVWKSPEGDIISNTNNASLVHAGKYTLVVGKIENNIYCENSFDFELIRSVLPTIKEVKFKELSDNNFIEIIAEGYGDFEYSIDGINYQDSNYFSDVQGGNYIAYVRDKEGCGEDSKEVTVIDYPKFFTPNNDGHNDLWQISVIKKFPNSKISIFDRYGKLLKELSSNDSGWDGFYNGKEMLSDDYWFRANFNNKVVFSGHFALKR
ncbi:T9SS type B sorting domain-containing protein [Flavobacterium sp. SLB02]|uniref:T9SS type B sorting domain-containing protein n=1 Tax=Flavobacterium sp. SLB02 TaxID=2665645 RepID=UPI0012A9620F|nr:T9SS type B sorting domain-containing protein [Flavobacterium sp. SLB02]QGK76115.1 T9SS type B sorting domain-containing protein [Flavobacterium sp. SLB02]